MRHCIAIICIVMTGSVVHAHVDSTRVDTNVVTTRPVTVTAGLTRLHPALVPFSMSVVDTADLLARPIRAVSDVLAYVQGVDLRQRGPLGVQSDVSIRGGTFEQAAIMIEGMRLNDVQTGHNTFSIPFLPSDIERIEVVKGGAARALGAGAMDGAVNIILKRPTSVPTLHASITAGDASYQEARLSASVGTGDVAHRVSAQAMRHDGWIPSSDVELQSLVYHGAMSLGDGRAQLMLGATNKAFGANGFYTPRFPEQWEKVTTYLGGVNVDLPLASDVDLVVRGLARINDDEFRLKRNDPAFYTNTHRTEQYLAQTGMTIRSGRGSTSILLEGGSDAINSSNLGVHDRLRGSILVESVQFLGDVRLSFSGGILAFSDRAPLTTGGIDASYRLDLHDDAVNLIYVSSQTNGRIPTYTDLYYKDPTTTGNPLLRLERARTFEAGVRRTATDHMVSAAFYMRDGRDMIDYAIDTAGNATAENISSVDVVGIDVAASMHVDLAWLQDVRLGLLYQQLTTSAPARTRYVADNLRSQAILETRWQLPAAIRATYIARLVERVTQPTMYVVHDVRLWRSFGPITLTAEATNLSSEHFVETGFVAIPPRWARIGISYALQ